MNEKEMLEQLHGLIEDRKAFITDDLEDSEIFRKDLVALEIIIENYKHLKQEIKSVNKGLRKVILKRKKWKDKYYKEKRDKKNLIKYLEKFISKTDCEVNIFGNYIYLAWSKAYQDILERVKNNNYD